MSNYKAKNPPAKKIRIYYDANGISNCLSWTIGDVEDWVEHELKLPQYKVKIKNGKPLNYHRNIYLF